MMRRIKQGQALAWLGGLAAAALLVGCHSGQRVEPATPRGARAASTSAEPSFAARSSMRAAGTKVTYAETPDGAALEFTVRRHAPDNPSVASGGDVAEVRRLARETARAYGSSRRPNATDFDGSSCTLMMCCAGTRIEVKDTPGGAKLHFAPDPTPIRKAVAAEAARMAR
ncbi:hypothetical protein WME99_09490 [Sorangium sp. So ce136]|uniref:hypothetical protein n=1 Tax=Sorangium sp. So ce136 TaxID=3133284 RepID=UPI003F03D056